MNPLSYIQSCYLISESLSWSISCYPPTLKLFWMLFGFVIALVFICLSFAIITTSREWRRCWTWTETGYRRRTQQRRHASFLIILILWFTKLHWVFMVTICMLFLILVASVSIDTLPWSACRLFIWHLSRIKVFR